MLPAQGDRSRRAVAGQALETSEQRRLCTIHCLLEANDRIVVRAQQREVLALDFAPKSYRGWSALSGLPFIAADLCEMN